MVIDYAVPAYVEISNQRRMLLHRVAFSDVRTDKGNGELNMKIPLNIKNLFKSFCTTLGIGVVLAAIAVLIVVFFWEI
jgi:hypothetical protein